MANITVSLVKELREKTGAGMMDCKKALTETEGDVQAGIDWLRKKGLSAAAKKASRIAAEGLVGIAVTDVSAAIVEINSETDFVSRNEDFQNTVKEVAKLTLSEKVTTDQLKRSILPTTKRSVGDELTHLIGTIGENISLRRSDIINQNEGIVASYMHGEKIPGLGKIGVLVGIKSQGEKSELIKFGRQIAMHIAASNPQAISPESLPKDLIQREKEVLTEQAKSSGKPENIIEKMVEGRIRKFYEEVALLHQTWVIDGETKVWKVIEDFSNTIGNTTEVSGFIRFGLGEGIERQETDFAAEVAATLSN